MRASSQASLPPRRTAVLVRRAAENRDPWEQPPAESQANSAGEDMEGREPVCTTGPARADGERKQCPTVTIHRT